MMSVETWHCDLSTTVSSQIVSVVANTVWHLQIIIIIIVII